MSVVILRGDAAHLPLPDESVDLLLCSPPYFGQRDYRDDGRSMAGQIGSEETPWQYLDALWACTREWVRVVKPSGSIFVNIADKYAGGQVGGGYSAKSTLAGFTNQDTKGRVMDRTRPRPRKIADGTRAKSLIGLPGLYASGCTGALTALGTPDLGLGLIRRADIIWRKNALPESVTDRTHAEHEYVFHFTRRTRYYSACDEIREPLAAPGRKAGASAFGSRNAHHRRTGTGAYAGQNPRGRIPGSVWSVPTEPLVIPDSITHTRCCNGRKRPGCDEGLRHDAAWPSTLVRRIILGWSPPSSTVVDPFGGTGTTALVRYEAIHASPPCQAYSAMRTVWNARKDHPDLLPPSRELLKRIGLPYVIENVPGAPMDPLVMLCGSAFGLGIPGYQLRRHRWFEMSGAWFLSPPCQHRGPVIGIYGDHGRDRRRKEGYGRYFTLDERKQAMGIDWMARDELDQAIPPAYTEFIGARLLEHIASGCAA